MMEDLENEIKVLEKELLDLKKTWLKLTKIKDSVHAKMLVPGPISFKEYEEIARNAIAGNVVRTRNRERTSEFRLHRLCGINFIEGESEKENECEEDNEHDLLHRQIYNVELFFAAGSTIYSGYSIKLKHVENNIYEVENYHFPYGMESSLVKNKSLSGFEDITLLLQLLRRCGNALFDRRSQVQEYINFCERHDFDVDVTTPYHRRRMEITLMSDVIMNTDRPRNVTFTLKYNFDSFLPFEVTYEENDFIGKEKTCLNYCMSEFLTLKLKKGFINILNNKTIKSESSDESLVPSKKNSVVENFETQQNEKLTQSRSQSVKEQEIEKNISERGSTASELGSLIPDTEEGVSPKQQLVIFQSKDISPNQAMNSADERDIPTTKQNDTNDIRLETMNEQQEDQCDLAITDLSSIVNSDEALSKDLQHKKTTKTLVSSTPLSRMKSAMTIYHPDSKKKITGNEILLRRYTRLTGTYHQKNIQEFMKRNENSPKRNLLSASQEKKIHKPGADNKEYESLEIKQSLEVPAREPPVSFNVQGKKVPRTVHRDTPLVQSSKRRRNKT